MITICLSMASKRVLTELVERFPSQSKIALVHAGEEKLRVAPRCGKRELELTSSLVADACRDFYNVLDALAP